MEDEEKLPADAEDASLKPKSQKDDKPAAPPEEKDAEKDPSEQPS